MSIYPRSILVASDSAAFLDILKILLPQDALLLSGMGRTADELTALADEVAPDAMIIDPALSREEFEAALRLALSLTPSPRVVMVKPAEGGDGFDRLDRGSRAAVHVECGLDELEEVLSDLVRGWRLARDPFQPAAPPRDESRRLSALHRYEVLDTDPEPTFDNLTRLARDICGTSVALISLVDAERQWFKARTGTEMEATARDVSFCQYAILEHGVTLVNDATLDTRFAANALVTGAPGIRFYAGAPLRTGEGHAIGTLCVLHDQPHALAPWQVRALETLAERTIAELELRLQLRRAERQREEQTYLRRVVSEASRFYEMLVDSIDGIVWECDTGRLDCTYVSAGVERLLGLAAAHWLTDRRRWQRMLHEEDRERILETFRQVAAFGGEQPLEARLIGQDGEPVWLRGRVQAIEFPGRPRRLRALTIDISEAKRAQAALMSLVTVDDLTGLPNRRGVRDHLRATLAAAGRHDERVAVMFLDLDRFKSVNDTLGHAAGDALIVEVARRLRACLRATDVVSRLGGDEFLVVAPSLRGPEEAAQLVRKMIARVCESLEIEGQVIHPSCSVGISLFPDDATGMDPLMRNADVAMYAAKQRGPGSYAFHDGLVQEYVSRRVSTEVELHRAIERDEFEMHYQPQYSLRTGAIVGAEALIRWRHPQRGLILPEEFISVSEETGQIHAIGARVISMVCRQIAEWRRLGYVLPRITFNASPVQFRNGLLSQVSRELHNNRMSGTELDIEITETTLARESEEALATLKALRNLGIRVTIDDFGVGYSSLLALRRYPVQAVKVDRQFVAELPGHPQSAAIVGAIVAMAHSMGLEVIAEGVETEDTLEALRRMGCDHFQGYVRAPALEADTFRTRFLQPE